MDMVQLAHHTHKTDTKHEECRTTKHNDAESITRLPYKTSSHCNRTRKQNKHYEI